MLTTPAAFAVEVLTRGIAVVTACVLGQQLRQWRGLYGEAGITPVDLARASRLLPTAAHVDGALWAGTFVCVLVTLVGASLAPLMLFPFIAWRELLSLAPRPWYGLQMHVNVLESIFLLVVGACVDRLVGTHATSVWLFRVLIVRVMIGCGACKYGELSV